MKENIEKTKTELNSLKEHIKTLEEKTPLHNRLPRLRKMLRPDFKLCPYCGENIT